MNRNGKILITGGAGYIGSHTCKALARSGFIPVTIDNLVHGHEWAVKWGPLEVGDLNSVDQLGEIVSKHQFVGAIHFAAYAYVGESVENPEKYYYNNVVGTLNLLKVLMRQGIMNIVFSSSCAVYGVPDTLPITETQRQQPVNPYGMTKFVVERILQDFDLAYGLRYASLRYFNAAGADPEGEVGEDHDPETHAVPLAIQATLGQRSLFEIYGTDYPTPDGTAIRDYVHVSDLAAGHVLAMEYLLNNSSIVLNLGTGRGHSVREVVAAVERVSGRSVTVREGPRRPGDPPVLVADSGKAKKVLGWQPVHSTIDKIVETAFRWHSSRR